MLHLIIKLLITALSLLAVSALFAGIEVISLYIAIITALILGIINVTLKPVLVILTLPINLLTLGLFTFVINGFFFWFVSSFVQGFDVSGFLVAIVGAAVVSVFSYLGNTLVAKSATKRN